MRTFGVDPRSIFSKLSVANSVRGTHGISIYSNSASILQAWESLIDMMEKGKINLYLALDIERTKAEEEKEEKETEQNPKLSSISKLSYFILLLSPPLPGRAAGTKANLRGSLLFLPNIFLFLQPK